MKTRAARAGRLLCCALELSAGVGFGILAVSQGALRAWAACVLFAFASGFMWESGWSQLDE